MAYAYTVDERYVNGSTSYLVGTWDAPGSINNAYGLAESDVGFGALVGLDSDVLGFGTLEPGVYRVIADDLTWDPYTSDIASIASFALLGAGGEVVQTSNVPGDYIEFTVGAAASYSVAIYGYGGSIAQYGVVYAWVMPASVTSDISAVLAEPQDNLILTGDADIDGAGNDRDNEIIGNLGNNALGGLGGDDTLFGGAGADGLLGGNGGDILDGGAGADLMAGESGMTCTASTMSGMS